MQLAFLSDIHANLAAFEAVLDDIESRQVQEIFCLGDAVGYGPDPEEVVRLLIARSIPCLMGNHEFALISPHYQTTLNFVARDSLILTESLLSLDSLKFLANLPLYAVWHGIRAVHGCPPDSPTRYLFAPRSGRLASLFASFPEQICLFGHTHILFHYSMTADQTTSHQRLTTDQLLLAPELRHLINIGSVGQPRDGSPLAKYILFDPETKSIEIRRLPYDVERTIRGLRAKGFPESNARRLL